MAGVDGIDEVVLNLNGNLCGRRSHILGDDLDAKGLNQFVFILEVLLPVGTELL